MRKIFTFVLLCFLSWLCCASPVATSAGEEELNVRYFIPESGCYLYYTSSHKEGIYSSCYLSWLETGPGTYKRICCHADQSIDYDIYQLENGKIFRLVSGFALPYSEYNTDKIIEGEDVVFIAQNPGFSWSNTYVTKDSWGNMCKTTINRKFTGYERINVLDREIITAKIVQDGKTEVLNEKELAGWGYMPVTQKSEAWYAEGLGLVKKSTHTYTETGTYDFTVYLAQALEQDGIN